MLDNGIDCLQAVWIIIIPVSVGVVLSGFVSPLKLSTHGDVNVRVNVSV